MLKRKKIKVLIFFLTLAPVFFNVKMNARFETSESKHIELAQTGQEVQPGESKGLFAKMNDMWQGFKSWLSGSKKVEHEASEQDKSYVSELVQRVEAARKAVSDKIDELKRATPDTVVRIKEELSTVFADYKQALAILSLALAAGGTVGYFATKGQEPRVPTGESAEVPASGLELGLEEAPIIEAGPILPSGSETEQAEVTPTPRAEISESIPFTEKQEPSQQQSEEQAALFGQQGGSEKVSEAGSEKLPGAEISKIAPNPGSEPILASETSTSGKGAPTKAIPEVKAPTPKTETGTEGTFGAIGREDEKIREDEKAREERRRAREEKWRAEEERLRAEEEKVEEAMAKAGLGEEREQEIMEARKVYIDEKFYDSVSKEELEKLKQNVKYLENKLKSDKMLALAEEVKKGNSYAIWKIRFL